jgi:hypothetical protein
MGKEVVVEGVCPEDHIGPFSVSAALLSGMLPEPTPEGFARKQWYAAVLCNAGGSFGGTPS